MKFASRWLAVAVVTVSAAWIAATRAPIASGQGRGAQTAVRPADLVLRGGRVVTVDDRRPDAQAIAIVGDTIEALGSNQEIQTYIGPETRVIELNGALATPGFIDAHAHFTGVGEAARNLKLSTAKDWNDIVRMVAEAAQKAS